MAEQDQNDNLPGGEQLISSLDRNDGGLVFKLPTRESAIQFTKELYEADDSQYQVEHVPVTDDETGAIDHIAVVVERLYYDADHGWFRSEAGKYFDPDEESAASVVTVDQAALETVVEHIDSSTVRTLYNTCTELSAGDIVSFQSGFDDRTIHSVDVYSEDVVFVHFDDPEGSEPSDDHSVHSLDIIHPSSELGFEPMAAFGAWNNPEIGLITDIELTELSDGRQKAVVSWGFNDDLTADISEETVRAAK